MLERDDSTKAKKELNKNEDGAFGSFLGVRLKKRSKIVEGEGENEDDKGKESGGSDSVVDGVKK